MNLRGVRVKHKVFGEGIIEKHDEHYIVISFLQGEKKFVYPDVFDSFISISDAKIAEFIKLDIKKKKQNKIKQQSNSGEKSRAERQGFQQSASSVSKTTFLSKFDEPWYDFFT